MKAPARRRRTVLVVAVGVVAVLLLTGCDDTSLMMAFFDEFIDDIPIGAQARNSAGRTGDDGVDGILDAFETVDRMREADKKMDDARQKRADGHLDVAAQLMDQVIESRPDDLRYRRERAWLALEQGDLATMDDQWAEMDRIAEEQGRGDDLRYWTGALVDGTQALRLLRLDLIPQAGGEEGFEHELVAVLERLADASDRAAEVARSRPETAFLAEAHEDGAETYRREAEKYAD